MQTVKARELTIGVIALFLAAPALWAQQAVSTAAPDTARSQVEGFELSLRGAIDAAAGKLSARVREAFPGQDFVLQYQAQPIISSVVLPDVGPVFHVLIPAIEDLSLKIFAMNARRPSPGQPVANPNGRVPTTGVLTPEPTGTPMMNPDQEYTTLVRASLIDAILDHALSLQVPPAQNLTVIAGELPTQPLSPFDQRSRMLILQIKGEDLTALKQDRITRDEAKTRIKESRYPN
jgi:hypothetical protein